MYKKFMKYINKIVEKIRNKELLKYILWKSGFNSALKKIVTFRHSKISNLIIEWTISKIFPKSFTKIMVLMEECLKYLVIIKKK